MSRQHHSKVPRRASSPCPEQQAGRAGGAGGEGRRQRGGCSGGWGRGRGSAGGQGPGQHSAQLVWCSFHGVLLDGPQHQASSLAPGAWHTNDQVLDPSLWSPYSIMPEQSDASIAPTPTSPRALQHQAMLARATPPSPMGFRLSALASSQRKHVPFPPLLPIVTSLPQHLDLAGSRDFLTADAAEAVLAPMLAPGSKVAKVGRAPAAYWW